MYLPIFNFWMRKKWLFDHHRLLTNQWKVPGESIPHQWSTRPHRHQTLHTEIPIQFNSIQFNSIQFNSIQFNANQSSLKVTSKVTTTITTARSNTHTHTKRAWYKNAPWPHGRQRSTGLYGLSALTRGFRGCGPSGVSHGDRRLSWVPGAGRSGWPPIGSFDRGRALGPIGARPATDFDPALLNWPALIGRWTAGWLA